MQRPGLVESPCLKSNPYLWPAPRPLLQLAALGRRGKEERERGRERGRMTEKLDEYAVYGSRVQATRTRKILMDSPISDTA